MRQCEGSLGFHELTASAGESIFHRDVNKSENKSTLITFFLPPRSAQVVTPSCSRSSPLLSRPAWSRRRSSWSWSTTWAPSRPCPPCRAPMQKGQRSAPWKTSRSPSRRPPPCLQVWLQDIELENATTQYFVSRLCGFFKSGCAYVFLAGHGTELPQGQMDSLLSIISSQRERFRSRNQELEVVSRPPGSHVLCLVFAVTWPLGCLFPPSTPAGESLYAADNAGPAEWAGQPEGGQHQAVWEDQVPAELPRPSMSAWHLSSFSLHYRRW